MQAAVAGGGIAIQPTYLVNTALTRGELVAVLPLLGVGGMQVYRAEATGPIKDSRLTPRLVQTARSLWLIYTGLTLACTAASILMG